MTHKKFQFSPVLFLAALGAGGIAVIPFAFFQYTYHTGKGLITYDMIQHASFSLGQLVLYRALEAVMIIFALIHIFLLFRMTRSLFRWKKTSAYKELLDNPIANTGILAPFIAFTMLLNVFIGPVRFYIPFFSNNFQALMLPALIVWGIIFLWLLKTEMKLLHTSFTKGFDMGKINFGWLLHPFALGMVTVTGTGIAAMVQNASIAHTAAFMSFVSGSMGMFLLLVKTVALFKSHFAANGLPEKQFMPSFLIVIPNITLYAISMFRMGHYLEHQFGMHLEGYLFFVIVAAFAFEVWYLLFGLTLMKDFIKKHFFKKEFYPSLWGLVCPFVAFAVLASFVFKLFVPSMIFIVLAVVSTAISIWLFFNLFKRFCSCKKGKTKYVCA